jgi:hypothetical protein
MTNSRKQKLIQETIVEHNQYYKSATRALIKMVQDGKASPSTEPDEESNRTINKKQTSEMKKSMSVKS